ncbi:hypothetical protein Kpol_534p34 [Vanderwaltozyma polyspora DSM 70294]|uniref:Ribosome biogenesis protein NSA1 n=1 Tax=Vanderwaltozyma polyspora (strain ATCC 22028 / DSM 70294 / BCRC 21397 / CBS 2163 / NBRC 10782 / NRRL Y-8283 / UCD 57-17) TaxID=436907 RepID=NSA1_VANPO|nr:uncharacterized protein Kpol_534p34 [Vanderwaltozyma polyspora DSM 70294]A7TJL1.1 RecName: Full=Ribosome biogenesis protein NSA1 [Vanderwaltozyma polyspora DSM 70294]EDO17554.1 hypothetical protein Kpol_534p34 [Vanderwaltozyma polyspora DSM 70294]
MRVLVSCTDGGSLKEVIFNSGTDTSVQTALQPLHVETHLEQGLNNYINKISQLSNGEFLIARSNGVVELVKATLLPKEYTEEPPEGKQFPSFDVNKFEVVDTLAGLLDNKRLEPLYQKSKKRTKLIDEFVTVTLLNEKLNIYILASKSGLIHIIKHNSKKSKLEKINSFEVKAPLDFAQLYDLEGKMDKYILGYGGEENLVKLIEINKNFTDLKQIWEAKNVKNDRLDMKVPIWPVSLKFLEPYKGEKLEKDKINYQFTTVSRYSHLGKYRTQHGRKPLEYKDLLPNREPLTQLEVISEKVTPIGNAQTSEFSDITFITTDTKKDVLKFNHDGRLLLKYGKGDILGSPTFITISKGKYLLQGGLDRYLRVFDINTNERIAKIYVGAKINYITLLDDDEIELPEVAKEKEKMKEKSKKRELEFEEDNDDQLWNDLDSIKHHKKSKI